MVGPVEEMVINTFKLQFRVLINVWAYFQKFA